MIKGEKVRNPKKLELAHDIADALGIERPEQSGGSSVDSTFLDRIHQAMTNSAGLAGTDAYRKAERVLQDLGLTYDPFWDTSESSEAGGSTVTNRAYSRIRSAVTQVPRCFLFNVTDAEVGAKWETDHHVRYRYDSNVTGRGPLNDAGPGSRIIYYSTSKSKQHPKHFIAHAEVTYIGPGWTGPWEAAIADYTELARPVPEAELDLPGWNHQHAITEITYDTYKALLAAAESEGLDAATAENTDPGGDVVAERVLEEIPAPAVAPVIDVPDSLPSGAMTASEPTTPTYTETDGGAKVDTGELPPNPRDSKKSKLAETRAVALATQAFEAGGWSLNRDCQKDGVGYDLLFVKGARELHVEVKGIMSTTLAFNVTPKEAWRVETDPDFVVVAVTSVLSPTAFKLHLITRDKLASAARVITGYRLKF